MGTSAQSFPMQRGIRQGCSLAPLLFAIFTGWLYDQLSSRVGEDWAREFITMYADDSLLQWIILRVSDLEHMCKCIRETFSLLTATGMQVNAAKSQLVIQLQGPEAKRWLKQHLHRTKDGPLVSVGTPAAPIYIPRVQSFQYLGVIASLGGYELQTCRHRLKACMQVRHRLLRILHSSGLRLRQRVTLYQACVRSSMTYGIHAVGVTPGVLDRLEAQDVKHLRGLAKSPAHLWHESTVVLRARLKIRSVHQTLMKLYQRRGMRSQDPESSAWFLAQHAWLASGAQQPADSPGGLRQINCRHAVACEHCGLYFNSMGQVRRHMRRMHGVTPEPPTDKQPKWSEHMHNGMPHCRHCGKIFTRVEGFRKHIRKSCIILHGREQRVPQSPGGEVPPGEERSHGHSCRTSPAVPEITPLLNNLEFRSALLKGWKQVLCHAEFGPSLRTYCILCGQWVSMEGPGVKQHVRLMHPTAWACKDFAASRCSSLGLSVATPCTYCGAAVKDIRMHLKRCSAVFQASLGEVLVRQETNGGADGGGSGAGGPAAASRGSGGQHTLQSWWRRQEAGEGRRARGQGSGVATEVPAGPAQGDAERRWQGMATDLLEPGLVEQAVQGQPRSVGSQCGREQNAGHGDAAIAAHLGQDGDPSRGGTRPHPHRHQFHAVYGRHAGGSLRPHEADCRKVARKIYGQAGRHESEGDANACAPGGDPGPHEQDGGRRRPAPAVHQRRVDGRGQHPLEPGLPVPPMESRNPGPGKERPPAAHSHECPEPHADSAGDDRAAECPDQVSVDEAAGQGSQGRGGSLPSVALSATEPSREMPLHPDGLVGMRMPQAGGSPSAPGSGTETAAHEGAGAGLSGSSLHGLDSTRSQLEPPAAQRQVGREGPVGGEGVILRLSPPPTLPQSVLCNSGNICYLNAVAMMLAWIGACSNRPRHCYGKAVAALQKAIASGKQMLPGSLPWMPIIQPWPNLHHQQDAGSFCAHLLAIAEPQAFCGEWQARLACPPMTVDSGPLRAPLPVEVQGPDLQAAVDHWTQQHAAHGLFASGGSLIIQLKRYQHVEENPTKLSVPLRCRPGDRIGFPVFLDAEGLRTCTVCYRVICCVFHTGCRLDAGHYQAAIGVPGSDSAAGSKSCTPTWVYRICEDNRKSRPAKPKDLSHIDSNAYLVGLLCDPGKA